LSGSGKIVPILHSGAQEFDAVFSPTGSAIAFISDETGTPEVYVQQFSAIPEPHVTGQKRQVSHAGAAVIRWRADGRELFYIASDNWITATALDSNGQPGVTQRLFQVNFPPRQLTAAGPALGFDVTSDGQRFVIPDTTDLRPSPFTVIQNWTMLLRGGSK
jgi:dipeptidyl aminopeptidase/acylaminoacyl peptidase